MKRLTDARLDRIARYYIERYWPSEGAFLAYMRRRLSKRDAFDPESLGDVEGRLGKLVETYRGEGLLDDDRWARSRARALWRSGQSRRMIRMKLKQKGIADPRIDSALSDLAEEVEDATEDLLEETPRNLPDLLAAIRYARKRRFGPFAIDPPDDDKRQKQLASLARRGFSYDICQQVMQGDRDEMELLLLRA